MLVKDQLGKELNFQTRPGRIISLVPSLTELLVDLKLDKELVGVTKFCVHPKSIRQQKTIIGGTKQVNFERIRALNPDVIIANKEENTQEMVETLSAICPVWVSDITTLKQSYEAINLLGELFDRKFLAHQWNTKIRQGFDRLKRDLTCLKPLKVVYLIWNDPLMAAGRGTFIDHMLQVCGLENIVAQSRYPEIDVSQLAGADIVLLSSEPFPFKEKHQLQLAAMGVENTLLTDGEMWSWYGSRLVQAADYLRVFRQGLRLP